MLGLIKGTVRLEEHQETWDAEAIKTIDELKKILKDIALDIQHVGSTAIPSIHAKPIIDIIVGLNDLTDIFSYINMLEEKDFIFRGEDVPKQLLFVKGDFESGIRTHHIHVLKWNGNEWNNYINFRDNLTAFPEKAKIYDSLKQQLAHKFPMDRKQYTKGKESLIEKYIEESKIWKTRNAE